MKTIKPVYLQGETELSFRLTPSLTRSYTKPRTKQLREEVILAKKDISLKDNSVSYCMYIKDDNITKLATYV